jgi:hypothetical protein
MELMVVMALILVMAGLIFSNAGFMRGSGVTNGGNMVLNEMSLARELSIAKNLPVELWFIRKTGGTFIDALLICSIEPTGSPRPAGITKYLPQDAAVDSGALSPIIASGSPKVWSGTVTKPVLPGYGTQYECWYVRFLPDGSTTLNITKQWYVTVHDRRIANALPTLPANYSIVSVSPTSGRSMLERP